MYRQTKTESCYIADRKNLDFYLYLSYFMSVSVLPACSTCTTCVLGAGGQKRTLDCLGLELAMDGSHFVGTGN